MRFAVYFNPAMDSALAALGAEWLGRDAFTGERLPQPLVAGLAPDEVEALTADPRRYGFHATLKPPFALREGTDEAGLSEAFSRFAAARAAFQVDLVVARLGGFLAIVPAGPAPALHQLADDCVTAFEPFRAPLGEADVARRRKSGLTPRQEAHLTAWGYPYVFDEFLFHMTLSGRIDGAAADRMEAAAREVFADALSAPVPIDTLGLFVEPAPGEPFIIRRTAHFAS